ESGTRAEVVCLRGGSPDRPRRSLRAVWLPLMLIGSIGTLSAAADVPPPTSSEPITAIPMPVGLDPRRVALGEQLFQDQRLSRDTPRPCRSCHDPRTNGASANARDLARDGQPLSLNTPTVFNVSLNFHLNWEGNIRTLEREIDLGL